MARFLHRESAMSLQRKPVGRFAELGLKTPDTAK
jgi:hypothetical protein